MWGSQSDLFPSKFEQHLAEDLAEEGIKKDAHPSSNFLTVGFPNATNGALRVQYRVVTFLSSIPTFQLRGASSQN
jgi:hypothetical protein